MKPPKITLSKEEEKEQFNMLSDIRNNNSRMEAIFYVRYPERDYKYFILKEKEKEIAIFEKPTDESLGFIAEIYENGNGFILTVLQSFEKRRWLVYDDNLRKKVSNKCDFSSLSPFHISVQEINCIVKPFMQSVSDFKMLLNEDIDLIVCKQCKIPDGLNISEFDLSRIVQWDKTDKYIDNQSKEADSE